MAKSSRPGRTAGGASDRSPPFRTWSKTFLSNLASSSNVTQSAKLAGISTQTAYEARRTNTEFQRAWFQALCEGYDHLEMETLHRLRIGELKPAAGAKKGKRVFDNANALRLMAAHRQTVAGLKAEAGEEDEEDILASLDAKLEAMRQRWLAAREREDDQADDEYETEDEGDDGAPR